MMTPIFCTLLPVAETECYPVLHTTRRLLSFTVLQIIKTVFSYFMLYCLKQVAPCTVNVDFLGIEYMVLAKYQHMSILELIFIIKQHILILCKKATHVIKE